ncbi:MFS transporter [Variovorax sp. LG9.2]|uniref:MFS transporter n=1 Tax=Variovorax sp. LG9.2 TaxID=3048626 RepID=UPI002B235ED1|nr:MFS transporter [Variovorax sp. LG9.2]MEB0059895.1 MFS transporter [Variovorax sp. LG9.2]
MSAIHTPLNDIAPPGGSMAAADAVHREAVVSRFTTKLAPYLALLYLFLFLDRTNISFAALQMNKQLGLSATAFGLAVGMFSVGYFVFEIPSTLMLRRFGARRWLARIMISWGVLSLATAFIQTETSLYVLRFLVGAAEAGFVPGILYYLTRWIPAAQRGRVIGIFMLGVPMATIVGSPISGLLLGQNWLGLHGWQWLFIVESVPSILLGISILYVLPEKPADVTWLTPSNKVWLQRELDGEHARAALLGRSKLSSALASPIVLMLGLIYLGNGVGLFGTSAFMPLIIRGLGLSYAATGWAMSFIYVLMALWMIFWTRHSDKTGERIWHVAGASLLGVACLVGAAAFSQIPVVAVVWLAMSAILMNPATPSFWNLPPKYLSGAGAAAGIAWISSIGALGAFLGPLVLGFAKDHFGGYAGGLLLIALGPLLSAVLTLSLKRHKAFARAV